MRGAPDNEQWDRDRLWIIPADAGSTILINGKQW